MTQSAQHAATEILAAEQLGGRFVDIAVDVRNWGANPAAKKPDYDTSKSLLSAGGVWDRRLSKWTDARPTRYLTWHVHAGQEHSIDWFGRWLEAYIAGDRLIGFEDVYSMLNVGGRRGGKSDASAKLLALFGVAVPESIVWLICPALRKTEELRRIFRSIPSGTEPGAWGRWSAGQGKLTLWTGTEYEFRTGDSAELVKDGRCDVGLLNESQMMDNGVYRNVRAPIADTGGLIMLTANPPDTERGFWVQDVYDAARGGTPGWVFFEFSSDANPTIDHRALETMRDDPAIGEDEFLREVKGQFLAVGDRVFSSWSPRLNVREIPDHMEPWSREFTQTALSGWAYDLVAVADFQRQPMVASVWDFFRDPAGIVYSWCVASVSVDGDEFAMMDAVDDKGRELGRDTSPQAMCFVADATGEYQDAGRNPGKNSWEYLESRGYRVFAPDQRLRRKNPDVIETVRTANAMMRTASGHHRINALPSALEVVKACTRWKNKNGYPNKMSQWAHVGDTVRYMAHRFFPRTERFKKFEYEIVEPSESSRDRELDGL
jgi:hypothetical protein